MKMSNIDKILAKKKQYESYGEKIEFQKKILRPGDNRFRIIGDVKFVYEHWFISADGVPIHSICCKDENGKGECAICKKYNEAQMLLNGEAELTAEQLHNARIIVGEEIFGDAKFPNSWKAREYAYFNVIDRDNNWCKDNKHTVILCKSASQAGLTSGKGGIFNEIIDVIDENGDYETNAYDIRIKKSGRQMETDYRGYLDKEVALTPEEKQYAIYDLDEITRPTPEDQLIKWLTIGVKKKDDNAVESKEKVKIVSSVKKPANDVHDVKEDTLSSPEPTIKEKMKTVAPKVEEVEMAECPSCGKEIPITSSKCQYCHIEFENTDDIDM